MKLSLWGHGLSWSGNPLAANEFAWSYGADGKRQLRFHCPNGRGMRPGKPNICSIEVVEGSPQGHRHGWDGNVSEPTLTPSVGCDNRCGWHGHITRGEWLPASGKGDSRP